MSFFDSELFSQLSDQHPIPSGDGFQGFSYGTAGFRMEASLLDSVIFRSGLLAILRSMKKNGQTIGVMITASHNPAADNGVKLIDPRGEMLEASWESKATLLANAQDTTELKEALESIVKEQRIDLRVKPKVIFGRDTRPSGPALCKALEDGFKAMSVVEIEGWDKGIVTTPQLHYLVRCENTASTANPFGKPTLEGYYEKTADSFKKLVEKKSAFPAPLLVDCANGVGANALKSLIPLLPSSILTLLPTCTDINNPAILNLNVGADYVKTSQSAPPSVTLKPGELACSLDGDADRIVFYYLDENSAFKLLDGDKIASLAAVFLVELIEQAGLKDSIKVGVVQTAYANGSSTSYLKERLPVTCASTGVKHLHHAAERFDIGVYFEANGHGTVLFSPTALSLLREMEPKTPGQATALQHVLSLTDLINQTVGDAISDLLLVVVILIHRQWGPKDWDSSYIDLPNRLMKVTVKDRSIFTTEDAERVLVTPRGLQAKIDNFVGATPMGRSFVRPSGTEDCVRVYAEASTMGNVEMLALQVAELVRSAK